MTEATQHDTLEVSDLDQFVKVLTAWHENKVKTLEHMSNLPPGTKMQIGEGKEVDLDGDMLLGFQAGITLALIELGILPFSAEPDEPTPG